MCEGLACVKEHARTTQFVSSDVQLGRTPRPNLPHGATITPLPSNPKVLQSHVYSHTNILTCAVFQDVMYLLSMYLLVTQKVCMLGSFGGVLTFEFEICQSCYGVEFIFGFNLKFTRYC